ncbi:interferon-induced transmembrane protein 1-like [Hyla sarda]|uniref:interferon-induced transmembrane protein 1-like n=1 Tax=Hyla sarda TaxID=327740 RepID=UPI0024C35BF2|nr:interferon-induced transmembrane protein 1-like [Hyla sarda]XP_056384406.1 interferon-induced transmembrane protein 1-like [Hyla sarda]
METKEDISTQQVEEPLSKSALYYVGNEGEELSKVVEMIPLKDTTIQVESTKVAITSGQAPVRDHVIWSIVNTFYMNFCCLGLIALIFSVKSRDQKMVGNYNEARNYGARARSLNIASTVLTILWFLITVTIMYFNLVYLMNTIRSWLRM